MRKALSSVCIIIELIGCIILIVSLIASIIYTFKFAYTLVTAQLTKELLMRFIISVCALVGSIALINLANVINEKYGDKE